MSGDTRPTMTCDVAVVGGGPAGAAAALTVAAGGRQVVLIEKQELPRYKVCGGGVVSRLRDVLPADALATAERSFHAARMNLDGGALSFEAKSAQPLISMTMRAEFDHALMDAARQAGAVLLTGEAVLGLDHEKGRVRLRTESRDVLAAFVVAADGVNSTVARCAGWSETRLLAPAIEVEVEPANGAGRLAQEARFDFDILPHGYAWVFPKKRHLSVGVLSVRGRRPGLPRAITAYMNGIGLGDPVRADHYGSVIPLSPRTECLARNRIFLVGDAAGVADPVTGEGISGAWLSGRLAGEALLEGDLQAAACEERFMRKVSADLLPELESARMLAGLLYSGPRLREWAFRGAGDKLCRAVGDVFCGKKTYRGLIQSSTCLKLFRMVARAGASLKPRPSAAS